MPWVNAPLEVECFGGPSDGETISSRNISRSAGDYFMMGDNRGSSDDGRFWGPGPKGWIIGKKFGPTY